MVVPTRGGRDLARFAGYVDYVVVDGAEGAKAAEAAGVRWVANRYVELGKSGALATALEAVDADLYVFIDDAHPGPWLEALRGMCGRFATAYRWVLGRLQNAFSLGGLDWMVWRRTRFLYGGAMTVPGERRREAVEALRRCPVDDMALTKIAGDIAALPLLVPMDPAPRTWEFFIRQAVAARLGNPFSGGWSWLSTGCGWRRPCSSRLYSSCTGRGPRCGRGGRWVGWTGRRCFSRLWRGLWRLLYS